MFVNGVAKTLDLWLKLLNMMFNPTANNFYPKCYGNTVLSDQHKSYREVRSNNPNNNLCVSVLIKYTMCTADMCDLKKCLGLRVIIFC